MSPQRKNLIASIYAVQVLAAAGLFFLWDAAFVWLTVVGLFLFVSLGLECYMHRYLAHQSYKLPRWAQVLMAWFSVFALQGSPLMWPGYHVTHHRFSDRDGDPHPSAKGWRAWAWLTGEDTSGSFGTAKRLRKDATLVWLHDHYLRVYWTGIVLAAAFDPRVALYLFLIPAAWAFHASGFVTVVLHRYGYRNFDTPDLSRNLLLANLFVGSPLHNNHHANPGRYNDAVRPWEFDFHGALISLIRRRS